MEVVVDVTVAVWKEVRSVWSLILREGGPTKAGAVTVLVALTVVVAGVMDRQEQAAEILLEAYALT